MGMDIEIQRLPEALGAVIRGWKPGAQLAECPQRTRLVPWSRPG